MFNDLGDTDKPTSHGELGLQRRRILRFGTLISALTGASAVSAFSANSAQAAPGDKPSLNTYIPIAEKGSSSGVAALDAAAKIVHSQLPDLSATYAPALVGGKGPVRKDEIVINGADYGMTADGEGTPDFTSVFTGTDNTVPLRNAIAAAQTAKRPLFIPAGKYRLADTVTITGNIVLQASNVTFLADIRDQTKSVIKLIGVRRGRIEGFTIYGCGYLPKAGIEFATSDSQACTLYKITIKTCRHGIYINEPEIVNRIIVDTCDLSSNFIAGFWMNSYVGITYGQSGPLTFRDTILNSNGVPLFAKAGMTYQGTPVFLAGDVFGYQIYVRGFINFCMFGGQISNHGEAKNAALAMFRNGSSTVLYGVDVEAFSEPVDAATGVAYADAVTPRANAVDGAALIFSAVTGVTVSDFHVFDIRSPSIVKFAYQCADVRVATIDWREPDNDPTRAKYIVDVFGSNSQPAGVSGANITRLTYEADFRRLTASAWGCLVNKDVFQTLAEVRGGITTVNGVDGIFDTLGITVDATDNKYRIGYIGADPSNPDWTRASYLTREVTDRMALYFQLVASSNSVSPDGRFIVGFFDSFGAFISATTTVAKGAELNISAPNPVYSRLGRVDIPSNARTVRFGFINAANYVGKIPDHAPLTGFSVWAVSDSPVTNSALKTSNGDLLRKAKALTQKMTASNGGAATTGTHTMDQLVLTNQILPPATAALRGQFRLVHGATGVADRVYVCRKNGADAYEWASLDN